LHRQRTCDGDALLLTAGKLIGRFARWSSRNTLRRYWAVVPAPPIAKAQHLVRPDRNVIERGGCEKIEALKHN
jgi:hypothetical protein